MRPLPPQIRETIAGHVNAVASRLAEGMERTRAGTFEIRTLPATGERPEAQVGTDDEAGFVEEWGTPDAPGSSWAMRAAWELA